MINTNTSYLTPFPRYSLRYFQNRYIRLPLLRVIPSTDEGFPGTISVKFYLDGDGHGTKCRRNIAENFDCLSRVHERYRRQTDRQTDLRRHKGEIVNYMYMSFPMSRRWTSYVPSTHYLALTDVACFSNLKCDCARSCVKLKRTPRKSTKWKKFFNKFREIFGKITINFQKFSAGNYLKFLTHSFGTFILLWNIFLLLTVLGIPDVVARNILRFFEWFVFVRKLT